MPTIKQAPEAFQETLPEDISNLSIDYLPLPGKKPWYNALREAGKTTIGKVYDAVQTKEYINRLGAGYQGYLGEVFTKLIDALHQDSTIDWENFWECNGIHIIPAKSQVYGTDEQRIENLPEIIKQILCKDSDKPIHGLHKWQVISSRFQLAGTAWMTQEALGQNMGISRARPGQLELRSHLKTHGRPGNRASK